MMMDSRPETTKAAVMPFGSVLVTWRGGRVVRVDLGVPGGTRDRGLERKLGAVLRGGRIPRELWVDTAGMSAFRRRVLGLCAGIRPGRVVSYAELARQAGRPGGARAVGRVMADNPFPLLIPCHRVVRSDMTLGEYGGGAAMKRRLLEAEGWRVARGRVRKPE
ncbi:MGMT family protein [candidate division WOR-3 bacterium]|nr:MGMT family protein [candidate division WOR-3 bacterium]